MDNVSVVWVTLYVYRKSSIKRLPPINAPLKIKILNKRLPLIDAPPLEVAFIRNFLYYDVWCFFLVKNKENLMLRIAYSE